ncbi:ADP-ribosyltransferase, partial [Bacillus cereus]
KIDELPKETKEKIERIDKSLEAAPTLTEDLTFFMNIASVKDENDKPNLDDPYDEPFYLIGDMKKTDLENEEDMRVELTVPKETEESVAYIENGGQEQIVFKRGKSYVLDKESAKISTENGKDVLVVKARLSSSSQIEFKEFANKQQAVEFLKKEFNDFTTSLSKAQKTNLENFKNDLSLQDEVNHALEKYREALDPALMPKDLADWATAIDEVLAKPSAKLKDNIYVHIPLTPEAIGIDSDKFYTDEDKIDKIQANPVINFFKYGVVNTFLVTTLTKPEYSKTNPIILKLAIPEGTAAGYVDDETLILSRNHGIEIKSIKIITDKIPIENDRGEVNNVEVEVVEVEGVIVSKDKVKKNVKEVEAVLNDEYKKIVLSDGKIAEDVKRIFRNTDKKILSFDIGGFYAAINVARAANLLIQLTQNVKSSIIFACVEKMNDKGAFTFTDRSLQTYNKPFTKDPIDNGVLGFYTSTERILYIEVSHLAHETDGRIDPFNKMTGGEDIATVIHEFGHAVDHLLFNYFFEKKSSEFKTFFKEYYDRVEHMAIDTIFAENENSKKTNNIDLLEKQIRLDPVISAEMDAQMATAKNENEKKLIKDKFINEIAEILAFDLISWDDFSGKANWSKVDSIIRRYIDNKFMSSYAYTDIGEFFAELFSFIYTPNTKIREQVDLIYADVVDFIKRQLDKIR